MFAEVYFTKERNDNAIVIPRSAVINSTDEDYVYIIEDGETAKKVVVTTGIDNGDEIEIVSGLSLNQRVVTKGQTYLKEGDVVNDVTNSDSSSETQTDEKTDEKSDEKSDDDSKEKPKNNSEDEKTAPDSKRGNKE
jgi:hypothetical protein